MKTRCPCCGAALSLDALVAHEAARASLAYVFKLGGELGAATCRYLSLFRPATRDLSMERVARLLERLVIDIDSGTVERRGQHHIAPPEAWAWAMRQAVDARDAGRLKTPLANHNYLYEVVASWRPENRPPAPSAPAADSAAARPASQTARAVAVLEDRIHGR